MKLIKRERVYCFISEITVVELYMARKIKDNPKIAYKAVNAFLYGLSIIPIFSQLKDTKKKKVRLNKIGKPMHDEFDL
jgi:tRNA(fMet)-specific endonuclease VapC